MDKEHQFSEYNNINTRVNILGDMILALQQEVVELRDRVKLMGRDIEKIIEILDNLDNNDI